MTPGRVRPFAILGSRRSRRQVRRDVENGTIADPGGVRVAEDGGGMQIVARAPRGPSGNFFASSATDEVRGPLVV